MRPRPRGGRTAAPMHGRAARSAGKTETSKIILQYLAHAATSSGGSGLEGRIIASTPVLEAFGNAQTHMNDNSSRYGKFLMLQVRRAVRRAGGRRARARCAVGGGAAGVCARLAPRSGARERGGAAGRPSARPCARAVCGGCHRAGTATRHPARPTRPSSRRHARAPRARPDALPARARAPPPHARAAAPRSPPRAPSPPLTLRSST